MKIAKQLGKGLLILLLFQPITAEAQKDAEKPNLETGTVEEQLDYVLDNSHTYNEYRVIKLFRWNKLKANIEDSMKVVRNTIETKDNIIHTKNAEIDTLNQKLLATNDKLATAIREKNSLKFVGMDMSKAAYNSMVWTIIAGLLGGLIIFMLLYKRSHSVIRQAKNDLEETKDEFEKHRKRALEREEQVVRKYHAELNKYKEKAMKHNS